jgi:hypothetical protein
MFDIHVLGFFTKKLKIQSFRIFFIIYPHHTPFFTNIIKILKGEFTHFGGLAKPFNLIKINFSYEKEKKNWL